MANLATRWICNQGLAPDFEILPLLYQKGRFDCVFALYGTVYCKRFCGISVSLKGLHDTSVS